MLAGARSECKFRAVEPPWRPHSRCDRHTERRVHSRVRSRYSNLSVSAQYGTRYVSYYPGRSDPSSWVAARKDERRDGDRLATRMASFISPAALTRQVAELLELVVQGNQQGKKKAAAKAFSDLVETLRAPNNNAPYVLLTNRKQKDPTTWDSVFRRVCYYLWDPAASRVDPKMRPKKPDVEKLGQLVKLATGAGRGALSERACVIVFEHVLDELMQKTRTKPVNDKDSAHVELIGILLLMTQEAWWVERVPPRFLDKLFEEVLDWINDDGTGRHQGPHASIASQPRVMRQYAEILKCLMLHWRRDMPVEEDVSSTEVEDGPFCRLLDFFTRCGSSASPLIYTTFRGGTRSAAMGCRRHCTRPIAHTAAAATLPLSRHILY